MRFSFVAVIVLVSSMAAEAQHFSNGWVFTANAAEVLGRASAAGVITTLVPRPALPLPGIVECVVQDADNRAYIVAYHGSGQSRIVHIDSNGMVVTTVQTLTGITNGVHLDQDGNYTALVSPNLPTGSAAVVKVNRGGGVTTLHTSMALGDLRAVTGDVGSGDLILTGITATGARLFRMSRNGSVVSVVAQLTAALTSQVSQHAATGDYYLGATNLPFSPPSLILRVTQSGKVTTFLKGNAGQGVNGVHVGRSSAARPRLAFMVSGVNSGFFLADLNTGAVTTLAPYAGVGTHLMADRGRNVATVDRQLGVWEISLSFPGEVGLAYAVGLSLTGTQPPTPLVDGRRLAFAVDALTPLSLSGALSPLFVGHSGLLGPGGTASAFLRLSTLPGLSGTRLWIQAVTLDPAAPLGIRTIAEPVVLVL